MLPKHLQHPLLITEQAQLERLCSEWSSVDLLALDTEFLRTETFYPIPGLLQVSDDRGVYLIDPLALDDLAPLTALMVDPSIVKVLHSCSEDLEVFQRLLGVIPEPIADTQIGAALAGYGFSLSYQKLVDHCLGIHVPKDETRSDWTRRPLNENQIHYAALDVAYLPAIYRQICGDLEALNRLDWWREECAPLKEQLAINEAPEEYYRRVKSAWKLDRTQLAVLRTVCEWRELQARERDRPRSRILKDPVCLLMAQRKPTSLRQLAAIEGCSQGIVRHHGETLIQRISEALSLTPEESPERLPKPLNSRAGALLKLLKAEVARTAERLNLPPEMLLRKRDYEALIRSTAGGRPAQLPVTLQGWRKSIIGDPLVALIEETKL